MALLLALSHAFENLLCCLAACCLETLERRLFEVTVRAVIENIHALIAIRLALAFFAFIHHIVLIL